MTGKLLAIDPGGSMGYALIAVETEQVLEAGRLDHAEPYFRERLQAIMRNADYLAIEAQFIRTGPRANMQTVQRIIERKQEAVFLWEAVKGRDLVPRQVQPRQWQAATRVFDKAGSIRMARAQTNRQITCHDVADAINLGGWAVREMKSEKLINQAEY